tara:strand:- start:193 stop:1065 length:873 start_codon:yes stop_codon:yes gene_type:complete
MLSKLVFLISESFRGLFRTKLPVLISCITIAISLVIISIAIFTYYNFIGLSKNIKSEFGIEVFFEHDIAIGDATDLYNQILLIDGIEQGEFIDKDRASKIFEKNFGENVQSMLGENPLPMSANYIVSMDYRFYEDIKGIILQINRLSNVEDVIFQKDTVRKINRIMEMVILIGFLIGLFILFISIVLVSNTIALIIYSKQTTIEILQLLGATNIFIKIPFILEGIIQGFLGSILSIICLFILNSIQIYFSNSIINTELIVPAIIIPSNIILGLLLGLIGSYRGLSMQFKD